MCVLPLEGRCFVPVCKVFSLAGLKGINAVVVGPNKEQSANGNASPHASRSVPWSVQRASRIGRLFSSGGAASLVFAVASFCPLPCSTAICSQGTSRPGRCRHRFWTGTLFGLDMSVAFQPQQNPRDTHLPVINTAPMTCLWGRPMNIKADTWLVASAGLPQQPLSLLSFR